MSEADSTSGGSDVVGREVADGRQRLRRAAETGLGTSAREADLLAAHVLGWTEAQVRARDDRALSVAQRDHYRRLIERRVAGEPVAYLTGRREFFGRELSVDDRVLIPRPETEHLIEAVLSDPVVVESAAGSKAADGPRLLDVGTGSGCIAVTLACELPTARVTATDLSTGALEVARRNARRLGVGSRVDFLQTHLAAGLDLGAFDVLVSNPPYVANEAAAEMSPEVADYEPHLALFAEDQGRALIVELLDAAVGLRSGAAIWLELGYDQGDWILGAMAERPHLDRGRLLRDYSGHPRVAGCVRA